MVISQIEMERLVYQSLSKSHQELGMIKFFDMSKYLWVVSLNVVSSAKGVEAL